MISALSWIPRGVAKSVPQEAALTAEELAAAKVAAEGNTLRHRSWHTWGHSCLHDKDNASKTRYSSFDGNDVHQLILLGIARKLLVH